MHELWITQVCNTYLAGPVNALFRLIDYPQSDKPWTNYMAMELLVVLILLALPLFLGKLSVERPGGLQQIIEVIYEFLSNMAHDIIGHGSQKHVPLLALLFIFILSSNLIGIIPAFESPTMFAPVPLGCAVLTFLYYNIQGFKAQGAKNYLLHFAGPIWWLAWFMFPLEIISHLVRPVSLTIRLFANMLAGEEVTVGFLALVPVLLPVIFMGLHVFVSFLQAFIFTVLTMIYIGGATEHAEDH